MKEDISFDDAICPIPLPHKDKIVMGHGAGGKMTHDLVKNIFLPHFKNPALLAGDDSAIVKPLPGERYAITTDSHVVKPLFFPGGDIGRLAVCGTVNDLAVMGATPLYLTAGFILEEGLSMDELQKVIVSMRNSAAEAGVSIIAGDTKVVQKGFGDGIYINTSGFGVIPNHVPSISGANAKPGDSVIISGSIGSHGIAVLAARGELGLNTGILSDVAPINHLVQSALQATNFIHVLRDPTRGGLATTLNEIAIQSNVGIQLVENQIPVDPAVRAACEILGFDPLYVANEGKVIIIAASEETHKILEVLHSHPLGKEATKIGTITANPAGRVLVKTQFGSSRLVDMLSGEILPRIC